MEKKIYLMKVNHATLALHEIDDNDYEFNSCESCYFMIPNSCGLMYNRIFTACVYVYRELKLPYDLKHAIFKIPSLYLSKYYEFK